MADNRGQWKPLEPAHAQAPRQDLPRCRLVRAAAAPNLPRGEPALSQSLFLEQLQRTASAAKARKPSWCRRERSWRRARDPWKSCQSLLPTRRKYISSNRARLAANPARRESEASAPSSQAAFYIPESPRRNFLLPLAFHR